MKTIVVAYDKNYGIGAANDLLWQRDLPADLAHFKEVTTGHTIIMGRKTFDSIGRALANRRNIVISRSDNAVDGVEFVHSLNDAYELAGQDDLYVIGGGQIYAEAIESAERIIATEVNGMFAADVFFPAVDTATWHETTREHHEKDDRNKYDYDFVTYERG
jgi:dihydrofolate reductase